MSSLASNLKQQQVMIPCQCNDKCKHSVCVCRKRKNIQLDLDLETERRPLLKRRKVMVIQDSDCDSDIEILNPQKPKNLNNKTIIKSDKLYQLMKDMTVNVKKIYGQYLFGDIVLKTWQCTFLNTFLSTGICLCCDEVNNKQVSMLYNVYNVYYSHLNETMKRRRNGLPFTNIRKTNINEIEQYKEFVFRGNGNSLSTLDLSLKLGNIQCSKVLQLVNEMESVKLLKLFYNNVYQEKNKTLQLVNAGYFQSPPNNPGQIWHRDCEEGNLITDQHTKLPSIITMIVAITKQYSKNDKTTGSTVFNLGSHHCNKSKQKLNHKTWINKIVQPILNKGDVVFFNGNVLHCGGANNFNKDNRVVLYAVFHVLDKKKTSGNLPEHYYLQIDKNIEVQLKATSFHYKKHEIISQTNDNNFTINKVYKSRHTV